MPVPMATLCQASGIFLLETVDFRGKTLFFQFIKTTTRSTTGACVWNFILENIASERLSAGTKERSVLSYQIHYSTPLALSKQKTREMIKFHLPSSEKIRRLLVFFLRVRNFAQKNSQTSPSTRSEGAHSNLTQWNNLGSIILCNEDCRTRRTQKLLITFLSDDSFAARWI